MAERFIRQLYGARDRHVAIEAIRRAPDNYVCKIEPPTRTAEQNARLHALVQCISRQVVWYGSKRSVHAWKRIFAAALFDHELVPGLTPGSVVLVEKRTREMGVEECGDLMTLVEAFGAEHNVNFAAKSSPRTDAPSNPGLVSSVGETPSASVSR